MKYNTLGRIIHTHGLSDHPLFNVWSKMIARCYYNGSIGWKRYGGRGIRVCDEWRKNFVPFYEWAIAIQQ